MKSSLLLVFVLFAYSVSAQNLVPQTFKEFNNKFGYVDSTNGDIKIYWHFDSAKTFKHGIAAAKVKGKWGCIDENGTVIVPFCFRELRVVNDSIVQVDFYKDVKLEYYVYSGVFKNRLYYLLDNKYVYQTIETDVGKIIKVDLIKSDEMQTAIKTYRSEYALKEIKNSSSASNSTQSILWNSIQVSKVATEVGAGFYEFKTGVYIRNKFLLTGISASFQRTQVKYDTIRYVNRQIPIYWSNYFFFKRHANGHGMYSKLDLGVLLSEYTFTEKSLSITKVRSAYIQQEGLSKMQMFFGIGYKISENNKKAGMTIEVGYKLIPSRIPGYGQTNFISFALGVLL